MDFWKEHTILRVVLIAVFFVIGLIATISGWRQTGKMAGLGIMIVGVCLLLVALWLYNKPYERTRRKKN